MAICAFVLVFWLVTGLIVFALSSQLVDEPSNLSPDRLKRNHKPRIKCNFHVDDIRFLEGNRSLATNKTR